MANIDLKAHLFYDRGAVGITERWLTVADRRYRIDQLHNLRKARGRADRTAQRAACMAALSLPMLLAIGSHLPPSAASVMVVLVVAVPLTLAVLRFWLRPAAHLLCADRHGYPVLLYQSRDATEFGKISRHGPAPVWRLSQVRPDMAGMSALHPARVKTIQCARYAAGRPLPA